MSTQVSEFKEVIQYIPDVFSDERGNFCETYNFETLRNHGIYDNFIQDNQSISSKKFTLRGLHYQKEPLTQSKLVRVVSGKIMDVVVDLRIGSRTYGKHAKYFLDSHNWKQLYVPPGFAHGFLTLDEYTIVNYKVNNYYSAEYDTGVKWDDPILNIDWSVDEVDITISDKDQKLPNFAYTSQEDYSL